MNTILLQIYTSSATTSSVYKSNRRVNDTIVSGRFRYWKPHELPHELRTDEISTKYNYYKNISTLYNIDHRRFINLNPHHHVRLLGRPSSGQSSNRFPFIPQSVCLLLYYLRIVSKTIWPSSLALAKRPRPNNVFIVESSSCNLITWPTRLLTLIVVTLDVLLEQPIMF